jgi:hypothetical protein
LAKIDIDTVVDLAFAVEEGDPIDWGIFKNGKEQSIKMIAASIIEQFDKEYYNDDDRLIVIATITKLVTENMILHSQLMKYKSQES